MTEPVSFRVLFGGDDDTRKLVIQSIMPTSVDELAPEIKTFFGVTEHFRLQYKYVDFGNACPVRLPARWSQIHPLQTSGPQYQRLPPIASTSSSSQQPTDSTSIDSHSSNDTIILSSPESRSCSWPQVFVVPQFSYCAEMVLQKGNYDFNANGTLISLTPKVRSDILGTERWILRDEW